MSSDPQEAKRALETKRNQEVEHLEESGSFEKGDSVSAYGGGEDVNVLAQVAAEEKAIGTVAAIRTYYVAFLWAMYASVGAAIAGYDGTVSGAVLSIPSFRRDLGYLVDGQYVISAAWQSGFNAGASIAQMAGAFSTGWFGERIGRRGSLLVASILSIGSVFIQFFIIPHNYVMFWFGRTINGYAIGIYCATASSYCAEVSPLALRGITTGGVNFWIVIGQFLSNLIIQGTGNRTDSYAYRIPLGVQWFFSVVVLIFLPFVPESPWHLVRKKRFADALQACKRLFGGTGMDLDLHVSYIKETIELEAKLEGAAKWLDLFRGSDLRRTFIAGMVFVCQEMVGVQFVLGYSVYFFELAGFNDSNAFRLGVGTMALAILGNLLGIAFTNRLGRRPIFFWGMVACTLDCLLIGILSLVPGAGALWAMGVFTMVYMLIYQGGIGPLAYCIYAEISSARLRSKTVAWGVVINQLCALIINVINPYLINPDEANLQGKVGWLFGGLGVIFTIWSYFGIPETGGRTIDELDIMFQKKVPIRQFGTYKIQDADRHAA